jgi:hypothetical protein
MRVKYKPFASLYGRAGDGIATLACPVLLRAAAIITFRAGEV